MRSPRAFAIVAAVAACFALRAVAETKPWFPFDLVVTDVWVADPGGARLPAGASVMEGTPLTLHCTWAVRATASQGTKVLKELVEYPNLIRVDGHTRGIFPIKIPPGTYGTGPISWETGGIGVGEFKYGQTSHTINPITELTGEFSTGWRAAGVGGHVVSCALDTNNLVATLEKDRANNQRQVGITVIPNPNPTATPTPVKTIHSLGAHRVACLPSVFATFSADLGAVDPALLAAKKDSGKATVPLVNSLIFLRDAVQCGYALGSGAGALNVNYTFRCLGAQKDDAAAHAYWCQAKH